MRQDYAPDEENEDTEGWSYQPIQKPIDAETEETIEEMEED